MSYSPNTSMDMLGSGEETLFRGLAVNAAGTSGGDLRLTYFTARKSETIGNVKFVTSGAAGATPTLIRIGVYSEDPATGNLTLIASTSNDTTLFAAASTSYTKALSASFTKARGKRYAVGPLVVTAASAPSFMGMGATAMRPEMALAPRLTGALSGQSDLPSSITAVSLAISGSFMYAALLP